MRRGDWYLQIGYTRKRSSCKDKVRYSTQTDAEASSLQHMRRILFADVNAYWCGLHCCWHVGHRDKYWAAVSKLRKDVMWFELWNARN